MAKWNWDWEILELAKAYNQGMLDDDDSWASRRVAEIKSKHKMWYSDLWISSRKPKRV